MKNLFKMLSPLTDEHMNSYLLTILKPFNILDAKVLGTGIVSIILTYLSTFATNYLGISGKFAAMLLIVIIVDFITGTLVAINSKYKPTSKKGRRTIYKTGAYIFFIYVAYSMHDELKEDSGLFREVLKYFHMFLLLHITFWELFSVDENLKKLGLNLGITDLLKNVYNGIKNTFKNVGKTKPQNTPYQDYRDKTPNINSVTPPQVEKDKEDIDETLEP